MIDKLIWLNRNRDEMIEAWENGFTPNGEPIEETSYGEFISNAWEKFDESQVDANS